MNTEQLLKKYTTYRDNILWHIKTNDPPEHEIKKLNAQADIYLEMIGDLEKLSQPPTPLPVQEAAKEYVKNLQISSASIDPRRDRDRYLGFLAGHSFKEEEWVRVEDGLPEIRKPHEGDDEPTTWSNWVQCANEHRVIVYACMYCHERKIWYGYGQYLDSTEKVTHWRFFPQPPKTDK